MRETTVTEVEAYLGGAERRRELGLAIVFSGVPVRPVPLAVTQPQEVGRAGLAGLGVVDRGVSGRHAHVAPHPGGLWVRDLESRNGTYVDGVAVGDSGALARPGALVRVGGTLLVVTADVGAFSHHAARDQPGFVGGPALDDVRARIALVAESTDPVVIEGETGTGKEVAAAALHAASGRGGRFVAVNCAALAPELVEAELFGHARGAFSGATGPRPGLFRTAEGGTILLDEIGELAPPLQAKLLRVVETGAVRAVGEDREQRVDVRMVAATNRDLDAAVAAGDFRGDLLHRLAVVRLRMPPLRARKEDLPALAWHFLGDSGASVTAGALERLWQQDFPGNLRELRNRLHQAAAAARRAGRSQIQREDLPAAARPGADDLRARVLEALTTTRGNMTAAARRIGMARSALYETVRTLRVDPASFRGRS